ncbi:hypothetical protein D623_10027476 [Myotis brandtii]|uniref:Uncharacterized protein n=1 Tax=Myotis brandtii TaxID=109478 RepID=S7MZ88_MYOBR|nr:hypothetical protein D623_10027476 [Myotis brandtii]
MVEFEAMEFLYREVAASLPALKPLPVDEPSTLNPESPGTHRQGLTDAHKPPSVRTPFAPGTFPDSQAVLPPIPRSYAPRSPVPASHSRV